MYHRRQVREKDGEIRNFRQIFEESQERQGSLENDNERFLLEHDSLAEEVAMLRQTVDGFDEMLNERVNEVRDERDEAVAFKQELQEEIERCEKCCETLGFFF